MKDRAHAQMMSGMLAAAMIGMAIEFDRLPRGIGYQQEGERRKRRRSPKARAKLKTAKASRKRNR